MRRPFGLLAAFAAAAAPVAAQQDSAHGHEMHGEHAMQHDDKDASVAGGGTLPAGWSARPDQGGSKSNVKFVSMGGGYHVTLGPATILYRKGDQVTKPFHTLATFTQTRAPKHPEGYGVFIGGKGLDGKAQRYVYFLVRGDGKYLVKRRDGDKTTTIVDWTDSPAINKADADGKATNKLEVANKLDPSKLSFGINGQEVWSAPAKDYDWKGIVGVRVNHNLDVHVDGFALHQ
jgi:hypothetical protein